MTLTTSIEYFDLLNCLHTAELLAEEKCNFTVTSPGRHTSIIKQYSDVQLTVRHDELL